MNESVRLGTALLAVLGAEPRYRDPLHVGRPNVPSDLTRFHERLEGILGKRWLTNDGSQVREFEERISATLGVAHCVAMCNGTIALEIASRALGFKGEVLAPAFTFVASVHALSWQGIRPAFCDIDRQWHHLDASEIRARECAETSGILGVHLWGRACNVEAIESEARRLGVPVLFDASHAFGCSFRGRMIGGFGSAETFSFHATKFINTFEGGAVTTNDGNLAERMRFMRNFGFSGEDCVSHVGTNGKMSEPSAAFGLSLLDELDRLVDWNRGNYQAYAAGLSEIPGIRLLVFDGLEKSNYQYVVVEVDETEVGLSRDEILAVLKAEGVLARRYFYPGCHRMEPYVTEQPLLARQMPVTDFVAERVLVLPTGTAVTPDDALSVCEVLKAARGSAKEVRAALAKESSSAPRFCEKSTSDCLN